MIINSTIYGSQEVQQTTGNRVRFFDFDGTILKTQYVTTGQDATPPTLPTHNNLTFEEWNNPYTNIQSDIDIGANYKTTDGKTYLKIKVYLTSLSSKQPVLRLQKTDNTIMTVNWGDGTSQTTTSSGAVTITKTTPYTDYADYIVTIDCASTYGFDDYIFNSTAVRICSEANLSEMVVSIKLAFYIQPIEKISINKSCIIGIYAFYQAFSLKCVIVPKSNTILAPHTYNNSRALEYIVFPNTIVTDVTSPSSALNTLYALKSLYLPNVSNISIGNQLFTVEDVSHGIIDIPNSGFRQFFNVVALKINNGCQTVGSEAFVSCSKLTKLDFPNTVTTIGGSALLNCHALTTLIFRSTTPPTITSNTLTTGSGTLTIKIYVPDSSVNDYKTATNWSSWANYIYPLSEIEP